MAARGTLGAFSGPVTPGVNMIDIFKGNEIANNPESSLRTGGKMVVRKLGIAVSQDTEVSINGSTIPVSAGKFELGLDVVNVYSLVFEEAVNAQIYYVY